MIAESIPLLIVLCIAGLYYFSERQRKKPVELTDYHKECCEWNGGEPCPYVVIAEGTHKWGGVRTYVKDGGSACCKIRQERMKIAKAIIDRHIPTSGDQIITSAQTSLDDHKLNHPDEHEYLFGK